MTYCCISVLVLLRKYLFLIIKYIKIKKKNIVIYFLIDWSLLTAQYVCHYWGQGDICYFKHKFFWQNSALLALTCPENLNMLNNL